MEQALNPTRIDTKASTARVVPEMLQRRVSATSLERLEQKAAARSDQAGRAVGAELAAHADETRPVLPMVEALEKAKAEYVGKTTDGRTVVNEAGPVKAIDDLQATLMDYGDDISVAAIHRPRRTPPSGAGSEEAERGVFVLGIRGRHRACDQRAAHRAKPRAAPHHCRLGWRCRGGCLDHRGCGHGGEGERHAPDRAAGVRRRV
jgi:hypothetical protein